ncbi:FecR domain-containing protein [Niabella defluvii]|nr:FecR domain-containing protein [Niabella sp. I65]
MRGFGNTNRHLMLKGEAYFDVKHNASLPFIIQTGKVKTTVLGTAFNIKQVGDSVSVTVARGKVQVERDNKMLAMLTPGQQIVTSDKTDATQVTTAELEPVTAWMHDGLHFNNIRLADAVAQLQHRYNREIVLKTPGIANCVITLATPLSGTESLNNILDVICTILEQIILIIMAELK